MVSGDVWLSLRDANAKRAGRQSVGLTLRILKNWNVEIGALRILKDRHVGIGKLRILKGWNVEIETLRILKPRKN